MKKIIPALAVLVSSTFILNSCSVSNHSIALQNKNNTTEGPAVCFVQFNNGNLKQFTSLKMVTGVLTTPHLLGDGKEIISAKDIIAYQNDRHYAVSAKVLSSLKSANVAVETLPGFAVKIISGKLNVYSRKYYNGANSAEEYFLQSGNDGFIMAYSKEALKKLLKEDAKASEFFNSKVKAVTGQQKILTAVEMYNSGQLMTKN